MQKLSLKTVGLKNSDVKKLTTFVTFLNLKHGCTLKTLKDWALKGGLVCALKMLLFKENVNGKNN